MEQVINPSANSEKYIKETDTKVKEFSDKIDSLEKQYASVIKTKDDEITAEKKKVNDISSSLNSIISDLRNQISSKDSVINSKNKIISESENFQISITEDYTWDAPIHYSVGGSYKRKSSIFQLYKGKTYSFRLSVKPPIKGFSNEIWYIHIKDTNKKNIGFITHWDGTIYSTLKVPGIYDGSKIDCIASQIKSLSDNSNPKYPDHKPYPTSLSEPACYIDFSLSN